MNSIIDIADSLINNIAELSEFENVEFIKAYDTSAYNPRRDGITAVVDVENIERTDGYITRLYKIDRYGDVYSAKLSVKLYGGSDISGESLTSVSLNLKNAVNVCDNHEFITKSKISPIIYESGTNAVYREISFNIEYVLCEAVV